MRKLLLAAALVTVAALPVAAGVVPGATGSSDAPQRVFRTSGTIQRIAADGTRVAAATTGIAKSCDRVVVWAEDTNAFRSFKSASHCPDGGFAGGLSEVALAGNRVAWVDATGGNTLDVMLKVAPVGGGKTTTVALVSNHGGADEARDGDWLGSVVGHGGLLVYNAWSLCTSVPQDWEWDGPKCDEPSTRPKPALRRFNQTLLKVVNGNAVTLRRGPNAIWSVAVDGSRIVTENGGTITLFSSTGAVLKTLKLPSGVFTGVRLEGTRLVVIRNAKLELYSVDGGQLLKSIPTGSARATLRDLQSGLAAWVDNLQVHVVRLTDGKQAVFSGSKGPVDARLEPGGLFYSFNVGGTPHGRIVFVPLAKVQQKLG